MAILINEKEKALVHSVTGEILRPQCWDDLLPYIRYVESRGHQDMAQDLLSRVFDGEKIITKMIEASQKRQIGDTIKTRAFE